MSSPSLAQIADLGIILFRLAESAIARSDNATAKRVIDLGNTVLAGVKTAGEIDSAIAERVRALGAELDAGRDIDRAGLEALAADVRAAAARWNAAG